MFIFPHKIYDLILTYKILKFNFKLNNKILVEEK